MWSAIIQTSVVQIGSDGKTVEVLAEVIEGDVMAGMRGEIPLNRSISWAIQIVRVEKIINNQVNLLLDGENEDIATIIKSLNFADEMLVVRSPETA